MTAASQDVVGRIVERFDAARDPVAAEPMAAYMRDQFPFLGIATTPRTQLLRDAIGGRPSLAEPDLVAASRALWRRREREYQYAACWLLRRRAAVLTPDFVPTARHLITTKSWWDTVDDLAGHVVGAIVRRHRALES